MGSVESKGGQSVKPAENTDPCSLLPGNSLGGHHWPTLGDPYWCAVFQLVLPEVEDTEIQGFTEDDEIVGGVQIDS